MNQTTKARLAKWGWEVKGESPLELRHGDGWVATDQAANVVVASILREESPEGNVAHPIPVLLEVIQRMKQGLLQARSCSCPGHWQMVASGAALSIKEFIPAQEDTFPEPKFDAGMFQKLSAGMEWQRRVKEAVATGKTTLDLEHCVGFTLHLFLEISPNTLTIGTQ